MGSRRVVEKVEYVLLCLFVVCLVNSWQLALKVLVLMLGWMLVKVVVGHRVGNPALSMAGKWMLLLPVVYFAVEAVGLIYTENMEEGLSLLCNQLPFLVFPLYFLMSDLSYLNRKHVRLLLLLLVAALVVRFGVDCGIAFHKIGTGQANWSRFFGNNFDSVHHTYIAMYILLGLVVTWEELLFHWRKNPRWLSWVLGVASLCLVLYVLFIGSRTGVLCLLLLVVLELAQLLSKKEYRSIGIGLSVAVVVVGCIGYWATSYVHGGHQLTKTLQNIAPEGDGDIRLDIWDNTCRAIVDNMPWGVGIGDRMDEIAAHYPDTTVTKTLLRPSHIHNPHNQYLDTMLSTGVPGTVIMLAILGLPCVVCLRRRNVFLHSDYLFPFILIVSVACLFESILVRQMGILFFCFFYCLLATRLNGDAET